MSAGSIAGSGQGGGSSAAGRFRPGRWGWWLIIVGALAFISMTDLGHVVAILSAIVIIGLPIYFLLAALPSIFLILLFARFVFGAMQNFRAGALAWALAYAAAALFMVDYFVLRAQRENARLDASAQSLIAGDMDRQAHISAGGVIAIVRSDRFVGGREADTLCDDLCQRLLLNGFATRFLAITLKPDVAKGRPPILPLQEPAVGMSGTMYWLEKQPVCPQTAIPDNLRLLQVDAPEKDSGRINTRAVAETMRLKIASGLCLMSAPARLGEADGAFFFGDVARGHAGLLYGFKASLDTIGAWRTAYYSRSGLEWTQEHRATGVRYLRFPGALIPSYIHGQQLQIYNGFLRNERLLGAREKYADSAPVAKTLAGLGVPLQIEDLGRSDGPKIVDEALATKGDLSPMHSDIIDDYLRRLSLNRSLRLAPEDVRRVIALVADLRVGFNWSGEGAVRMVAEQQPQLAPEIARILFARLDALVASASVVSEKVKLNTSAVTSGLAALPATALKPYFSNFEAVAYAPGLRPSAQRLIARLDIFGPFAVPAMFRVMDESLAERTPRGSSNWTSGFTAGLRALCGLGSEAAFARPMLEERIARDGASFARANDRLLISTLFRMGASEAEIIQILSVDEKNLSRMKFAIRGANGRNACQ